MPQLQLPVFPVGTTAINPELAFERREEPVVYFNGHLPVFTHTANDLASFRFFTTQLIVNGTASQGEIVKAFGVPLACATHRVAAATPTFGLTQTHWLWTRYNTPALLGENIKFVRLVGSPRFCQPDALGNEAVCT
jgi:hypothetical protein